MNDEFDQFIALSKQAKARRRLHPDAERKLKSLLSRLYPDDIVVQEVSGVLGGRNDLMQFAFNGRRAVFEFFFTPDQVPQDLRLLEQAKAEVKVAILLDRSINPAVAEEYVRKKPEHFPYLWLSELMMPSKEGECLIRLREIVDENAPVHRLRRVLSLKGGNIVEELLGKELEHIERILNDLSLPSSDLSTTVSSLLTSQRQRLYEALGVYGSSPLQHLSSLSHSPRIGIYALYYRGDYEPYRPITYLHKTGDERPIYIGKCVPHGFRSGGPLWEERPSHLPTRLREQVRSISWADNLDIKDFRYRFIPLDRSEPELIYSLELHLIRTQRPLWNVCVQGFDDHYPGLGRIDRSPSEWDTLHPGRPWVGKLAGRSREVSAIHAKIRRFLELMAA